MTKEIILEEMKSKKRQELPQSRSAAQASTRIGGGVSDVKEGTLYVVATPIGNLEDLSPRARRILTAVDGILCEDTRVTLKLLLGLGIQRPLTGVLERSDQHASESQILRWVERLVAGESFALVSDAGTPAISDPGAELVSKCAAAGLEVVVIPGPSALAAFLSGAGFTRGSPLFRGFFPRKNTDRESEWKKVEALPFDSIVVWFESPERMVETVEFIAARDPEKRGVFAKELTKLYEKFYYGKLGDLASHIQRAQAAGEVRGEWVIGVYFPERVAAADGEGNDDWRKGLRSLLNSGVSPSRAAREVSQVFGILKKIAYAEAILLAKDLEVDPNEAEEKEE